MISPECDRCGNELEFLGGLLLSPPDGSGMVRKRHLCELCYRIVLAVVITPPEDEVIETTTLEGRVTEVVVPRRYRSVTHTWEKA